MSETPKESAGKCSQCGQHCGRRRLCRLRLAHKYIAWLIDQELEKFGKRTSAGGDDNGER